MANKPFPIAATTLTAIAVIILCSLGTWQIKRLNWKANIIAELDTTYSDTENPQSLTPAAIEDKDFTYGQITGIFKPDQAILIGPRTRDNQVGNHLIVPVISDNTTTLVNLGWTAASTLDTRLLAQAKDKPVTISGLARIPYWTSFTPDNNPQKDEWYKPDITEVSAAKNLPNPAPYILYAENINYKLDDQFPNNTRWYPKNNHAQYAAFWFGMSIILLIIYGIRFFKT